MKTDYCKKCESIRVPKGIKFCKDCCREINEMHENPIIHMEGLRAMVGLNNKKMEVYGFLSIMHPTMSDKKKRMLVSDLKEY